MTETEKADVGSAGAGETCPACGAQVGVEDWACAKCGAIAGTVDKFPAKASTRRHTGGSPRRWLSGLVKRHSRGSRASAEFRLTLTPLGIAIVTAMLAVLMAVVYLLGRAGI